MKGTVEGNSFQHLKNILIITKGKKTQIYYFQREGQTDVLFTHNYCRTIYCHKPINC